MKKNLLRAFPVLLILTLAACSSAPETVVDGENGDQPAAEASSADAATDQAPPADAPAVADATPPQPSGQEDEAARLADEAAARGDSGTPPAAAPENTTTPPAAEASSEAVPPAQANASPEAVAPPNNDAAAAAPEPAPAAAEIAAAAPDPAPAAESSAATGPTSAYQVHRGDTLMKIAFETYGDLFQWKKIYEQNRQRIKDPNNLEPGTQLQLEAAAGGVTVERNGDKYLIKQGQTLGTISSDIYGTPKKWKKLWNNNKQLIRDPNRIFAGFYLYYTLTPLEREESERLHQSTGAPGPLTDASPATPSTRAPASVSAVAKVPAAASKTAAASPGLPGGGPWVQRTN